MHYSMAMTDMVVLCPINMTAGAILHFVQTLTFAPVEMTRRFDNKIVYQFFLCP
jgi:hypothetical protein